MPSKSVIPYDKLLPEIRDRRPWERPDRYLVKDESSPDGWRIESAGRRPSDLLLIEKLRTAVDKWRDSGYPGGSQITQRLFSYWFDEEHEVQGFQVPFRYHFCQQEAMETLVYLVEVFGKKDTKPLIEKFGRIVQQDLISRSVEFQTTTDGQRQVRRYVPEKQEVGIQDLPPNNLRRYAFKMATGSGKTWVMAMAIVWSYFHRKRVPGSDLSTNFLIVAPNVIVYQRLAKDFASNQIFNILPLVPPEWQMSLKTILRGEAAEPDASGNLFLTNIQQLYERTEFTPANAVEAILGPKPSKDLSNSRSMLERVKDLKDLAVMNDEAHHVHDEDLAWSQSLLGIHASLPKGIAMWLDMSATPKDQKGMYYPWTVCDYPLAQAVEDRIVKAPIIVTREDDPELPKKEPENITQESITKRYHYWIDAAVNRWRVHRKTYKQFDAKPVLFIMAEKSVFADAIGEYLKTDFGFKAPEVLVIHTDKTGEITKKDLEEAREAVRDIDLPSNKIKVIVSVMMLREGWDVRNVSVVLGLRPFTAKAEILPEQVIGRGLRLMSDIGPDRTQTLEVLGTRKLLDFLRQSLETEGVGVGVAKSDPQQPVTIYAIDEKKKFDIAIPITKPQLAHNAGKLSELNPLNWAPVWDQDLPEVYRVKLKMEFASPAIEIHQVEITDDSAPMAQAILSDITRKTENRAKLPSVFAELYPIVRTYITERCFGRTVDIDSDAVRSNLRRPEIQDEIVKYLARQVAALTVESKTIEFENAKFKLSETKAFQWRRNLPPLVCTRTVFNYVATYNSFERRFAEFADKASDVLRFASLGTTEQGDSWTRFRVDYLKSSGAIGHYHPDWVVVQKTPKGEVNWIIETKGRVWEGTELKDEAIRLWCARITERTKQQWRFARINQSAFDAKKPATLTDAVLEGKPQSALL